MSDRLLSISEISKRTAVAPSALRYYERRDLIKVGVKIGGIRHYPAEILHRVLTIKVCQKIGFSLTEIAELLNGSLARDGAWRRATLGRRGEIEEQIGELRRLVELIDRALDCDCSALCECAHLGTCLSDGTGPGRTAPSGIEAGQLAIAARPRPPRPMLADAGDR